MTLGRYLLGKETLVMVIKVQVEFAQKRRGRRQLRKEKHHQETQEA